MISRNFYTTKSDDGRNAFTLTELLVGIAIIAVLTTLLISAATRTIEKSRESACAARLRAIGTGIAAYIADHSGRLIPGAVLRTNHFWFDELNPYMGFPQYSATYAFPDQAMTGTPFPLEWQQCPAKRIDNPQRQSTGYGWNYLNFGKTSSPSEINSFGWGSRISEIENPSKTIIAGDSKDHTVAQPDSSYGYQHRYLYPPHLMGSDLSQTARRHSGRGLYLMLDGHIEAYTVTELNNQPNLWAKIKP